MNEVDRDLFSGLIRLHVLYHAAGEPVYGQGMIEELQRHGYHIGPGTVYPLLHGLERKSYLASSRIAANGSWRKVYRITPLGRRALTAARERVRELFGELFDQG